MGQQWINRRASGNNLWQLEEVRVKGNDFFYFSFFSFFFLRPNHVEQTQDVEWGGGKEGDGVGH